MPSLMEPPHDSRREAEILKKAAYPNVIPLLDTFREDGSRFIIVFPFMQYDLAAVLRGGQFAKPQIKIWLKDLFSALAFIHEHGIIHRDVKPSNILLKTPDGPAYLADFGIAWAPNTAGSEAPESKITDVGTTCYRPPELLFGNKAYDCSLDLWAAGCTVAEILDPSHATLFDSGELGSDLALLQSIFKKLGTPTLTRWPVSTRQIFSKKNKLTISRRQRNSPIGARCNSTNILRRIGAICYRECQKKGKILLASWFAMRVGPE